MKRLLLILTVLIPATLFAQDQGLRPLPNQADMAIASTPVAPLAGSGTSVEPSPNGTAGLSAQTQKSPKSGKPEKPPRPSIEGSMVGYIDNPIVESQIRVRFDGAFDDNRPDRAEFFYAKCGCYRVVGADPNAPGPPPGSAMSAIPKNLNFQQLYIDGEFAPTRRLSVFAEIPLRWIQAQGFTPVEGGTFPNEGGLSDVMAGFKFAAIASEGTYLTFQARAYFPSGDASKGLGTNHYSIEPEVLLYHRFTDRLTLEGQVGDWHPINGSGGVSATGAPGSEGFAGDVFIYGIGPSYKFHPATHVTFSPVLELVGWTVLGGFQTHLGSGASGLAAEVSGKNIVNIKIGARTNIGPHNSFYIGYGHAVTSAVWYEQIVRAEYRYAF